MLKVKSVYEIETGPSSSVTVTHDQLIAIHLWLIRAYHDSDIKPLRLFGHIGAWFVKRDGYVVHFINQRDCLSMDSVLKLIKSIKGHYPGCPDQNDYDSIHDEALYQVKGYGDKLFGYINVNTKASRLQVALRYWEELECWYGICADINPKNLINQTHSFSDLSLGQV